MKLNWTEKEGSNLNESLGITPERSQELLNILLNIFNKQKKSKIFDTIEIVKELSNLPLTNEEYSICMMSLGHYLSQFN